ncbi:MAG: molybdopterin-binding protein [Alphaproteobacteria bacterium]|nr:molybdopterin-binding protein [Alphaproteobacteria bacterium]
MTAALIVIGSEVLSGRTRDANLPYLGKRLNELGVRLKETRIIPDDEDAIVRTVNECRATYDYVFTTGGIGPTHDDITAGCIAKAFGVPLLRHPEAVARLKRHYRSGEFNEARMRMANVPEGGTLIDNPVSAAPGFRIENVFVFAGVPAIMQAMFEGIKHALIGGKPLRARTFRTTLAEGRLAQGLGDIQARFPDVEIGSYPSFTRREPGVRIVLSATDEGRLDEAAGALDELVAELGGESQEIEITAR